MEDENSRERDGAKNEGHNCVVPLGGWWVATGAIRDPRPLRYHCGAGMCYKRRAVNSAAKQDLAPVQRGRVGVSVRCLASES